ncbi:MAG: Ig-like domain-containing protein, partial [Aminobacteriaceae bacterium]
MKKMILIFCALLLLLGTGISEGAPADEFSVLSFSPSGVVKGRTPVKITFSQPVVSREAVGKQVAAAKYPVTFSPAIRGDGKWTDSKTFVLTPLANLPQATLFRTTIKDDIRDLKGRRLVGKQVYEFSTEALKLLAIQQSDYTENGSVILDLSFNLPVSPFRLRGFLWLQNEKKQGVAYSLQGNAPSSRIQIAAGPYYDNKIGVVLAEGLTSDAGPLGIEKEIRRE